MNKKTKLIQNKLRKKIKMSSAIIKFILMASLTAGAYCSSTDRYPKVSFIYKINI